MLEIAYDDSGPKKRAKDLVEELKQTGAYKTTTALVPTSSPSRDSRKGDERRKTLALLGQKGFLLEIAIEHESVFKQMAAKSREGKSVDEIVSDQLSPEVFPLPWDRAASQEIANTGYMKLMALREELFQLREEVLWLRDAATRKTRETAAKGNVRGGVAAAWSRINMRVLAAASLAVTLATVAALVITDARVNSRTGSGAGPTPPAAASLPPPQKLDTALYQQVFAAHRAAYSAYMASQAYESQQAAAQAYEIYSGAYHAYSEYSQAVAARRAQGAGSAPSGAGNGRAGTQ